MSILYQSRGCFMAGIMVLFHISDSHAGQSDTFSGFDSILNDLSLPGFSRSDWGVRMGKTDVCLGEVKVVDDTHVVLPKVCIEINLESFSKLYGSRVFVDQIQLMRLDNIWQAVIADKIYLVCKDFSPCGKSFHINESEVLAGSGLKTLRFFAKHDQSNWEEKESSNSPDTLFTSSYLKDVIEGLDVHGLLNTTIVGMNFLDVNDRSRVGQAFI